MMKGAGVLAGLAVAFVAIFVIARNLLKKKMAVQEPTFEELPM